MRVKSEVINYDESQQSQPQNEMETGQLIVAYCHVA